MSTWTEKNEGKCAKRHFANSRQLRAVLSICHGVGVFNYYHNIMIIYKQKDKTHSDNILFDNTDINDFWCDDY